MGGEEHTLYPVYRKEIAKYLTSIFYDVAVKITRDMPSVLRSENRNLKTMMTCRHCKFFARWEGFQIFSSFIAERKKTTDCF